LLAGNRHKGKEPTPQGYPFTSDFSNFFCEQLPYRLKDAQQGLTGVVAARGTGRPLKSRLDGRPAMSHYTKDICRFFLLTLY
jgi:hypothetical protein